jgi:sulfoxide reductase heme-binding subunit YedZ
MHHDPTFWLLARASGLTAYVAVTAAVTFGIVVRTRPFARLKATRSLELHRSLAIAAMAAVALHGVALVLDTTVRVNPAALLVPGLVAYRPGAVAAGVVAGWLLLVVGLSSRLRRSLGIRAWRRLHRLTYALFGLATAHGVLAGSDSGQGWAQQLYLGAVGVVAAAAAWRLLAPPATRAIPKGEPA